MQVIARDVSRGSVKRRLYVVRDELRESNRLRSRSRLKHDDTV